MLLDAWIYALPAEWDALYHDTEDVVGDILTLDARAVYAGAVTGFWKDYGLYRVYNVLAEQDVIEEIVSNLSDVHAVYAWTQGDGGDSLDVYQTLPADLLAVMKNIIVYDKTGTVISDDPPSYTNPNWGHIFFGQKERVFAGAFSDGFNGGFK